MEYRALDLVQIRTTKNIKYLSAPPGQSVTPSGVWTIACAIQNDLLLTKDNAVVRVPSIDVVKVAERQNINKLLDELNG